MSAVSLEMESDSLETALSVWVPLYFLLMYDTDTEEIGYYSGKLKFNKVNPL